MMLKRNLINIKNTFNRGFYTNNKDYYIYNIINNKYEKNPNYIEFNYISSIECFLTNPILFMKTFFNQLKNIKK